MRKFLLFLFCMSGIVFSSCNSEIQTGSFSIEVPAKTVLRNIADRSGSEIDDQNDYFLKLIVSGDYSYENELKISLFDEKIKFVVDDIPVGSKINVKLLLLKNSEVLAEGSEDAVIVPGNNNVGIRIALSFGVEVVPHVFDELYIKAEFEGKSYGSKNKNIVSIPASSRDFESNEMTFTLSDETFTDCTWYFGDKTTKGSEFKINPLTDAGYSPYSNNVVKCLVEAGDVIREVKFSFDLTGSVPENVYPLWDIFSHTFELYEFDSLEELEEFEQDTDSPAKTPAFKKSKDFDSFCFDEDGGYYFTSYGYITRVYYSENGWIEKEVGNVTGRYSASIESMKYADGKIYLTCSDSYVEIDPITLDSKKVSKEKVLKNLASLTPEQCGFVYDDADGKKCSYIINGNLQGKEFESRFDVLDYTVVNGKTIALIGARGKMSVTTTDGYNSDYRWSRGLIAEITENEVIPLTEVAPLDPFDTTTYKIQETAEEKIRLYYPTKIIAKKEDGFVYVEDGGCVDASSDTQGNGIGYFTLDMNELIDVNSHLFDHNVFASGF